MLNELLKETNTTYTENGAAALRSTGSECLDLFATIGALRNAEEQDIVRRFVRAWCEDRDTALKILFYGRDIRGGLGERRTFRVLLRWLAQNEPDCVKRNLHLISEYGRWDDILVLMGTRCEKDAAALIRLQLRKDLRAEDGQVSLLAKWLPSGNASNADTVRQARRLAKLLDLTAAEYRRMLVKLRAQIRLIENDLRKMDYTFDYAKQPSRAMFKYRRAFLRNDEARYLAFMQKVSNGEAALHTGTLMPCELVRRAMVFNGSDAERSALEVTWNAMEDFTGDENALCVVDGSGSMYSGGDMRPIDAALSLGITFAEHNKGEFHGHFITFSRHPRMVKIKGKDLVEKVRYCQSFNEVADTNLQRVFELVLNTALKHRIPQEEMPSALYIITDMEFNQCTRNAGLTNFEYAKALFEENGYKLPKVVFWNVDSRNEQQPVSMNEQGVTLVSGASARVFSMVAQGSPDPYRYMMSIIGQDRYAAVCA